MPLESMSISPILPKFNTQQNKIFISIPYYIHLWLHSYVIAFTWGARVNCEKRQGSRHAILTPMIWFDLDTIIFRRDLIWFGVHLISAWFDLIWFDCAQPWQGLIILAMFDHQITSAADVFFESSLIRSLSQASRHAHKWFWPTMCQSCP